MEEKDYKKLYEDVVALAKDGLHDGLYLSRSAKDVTEFLFPQLKETEDEKVKRELTKFLINFNNGYYSRPTENEIDSWIKWIKKQVEQKTEIKYVYPKFRIGDVIEPINPNGFYRPVRVLSIEEKTASYYCESDDKKSFSSIPIRCEDEYKLVEQKPTDKVEPKFKAGDWVRAISSGNIFKILSFNDGLYRVLCYDGVEANYPIEVEKDLAYWTIQDAKDGDVLAAHECYVIFKEIDDLNIKCYCTYHFMNNTMFFVNTLQNKTAFHPATKEERDILFQKMKEAGYEWDAEKKELRKIEQNSSWSKEDEQNLNGIVATMEEDAQLPKDTIKRLCKWLKAIKNRVQPKQEWSKEDSERLARIHQFIWANRKGDTDEIYQQEQDADWIMSIIPQPNQYDKGYEDGYSAAKYNQWKPTDKQMEDFRMLLDYNIGVFDYAKFMSADSLYEDLKKNLIN